MLSLQPQSKSKSTVKATKFCCRWSNFQHVFERIQKLLPSPSFVSQVKNLFVKILIMIAARHSLTMASLLNISSVVDPLQTEDLNEAIGP